MSDTEIGLVLWGWILGMIAWRVYRFFKLNLGIRRLKKATDLTPQQKVNQAIALLTPWGYTVDTKTDDFVQVRKRKRFSFIWAVLWACLFGFGFFIYLFWYMSGSDEVQPLAFAD